MNNSNQCILVQLQYTCYICLQKCCDAKSLNFHLSKEHYHGSIVERDFPTESIYSNQFQYLNLMTTTVFDVHYAQNVQIRQACSICYQHFENIDLLSSHMIIDHFSHENQDESNTCDETIDFLRSYPSFGNDQAFLGHDPTHDYQESRLMTTCIDQQDTQNDADLFTHFYNSLRGNVRNSGIGVAQNSEQEDADDECSDQAMYDIQSEGNEQDRDSGGLVGTDDDDESDLSQGIEESVQDEKQ
ncbi:hypothetical protein BD408DRAFT_418315 [Parasitella parasitica]|nr:hypothetical protein BD408DRAFT_418315 [Parasitella parasitica]